MGLGYVAFSFKICYLKIDTVTVIFSVIYKWNIILFTSLTISFCYTSYDREIQLNLILAEEGDTVEFDEGLIQLLGSLSLQDKENLIIRGKGINRTIIDFSNQVGGKNGFNISNCKNIVLEELTILPKLGHAIRCLGSKNIVIRKVKTNWARKNFQPVGDGFSINSSSDVIVDDCINSSFISGISVEQSNNIVIRFSETFDNILGIRVANSINVDIHSNNIHHNSSGLYVYAVPDMAKKKSERIRIFNNIVRDNNGENLSPFESIFSQVPTGQGIMIMASDFLEIFDNTIIDNKTAGTSIFSYPVIGEETKDAQYNPYSSSIFIHDNIYRRSSQMPTLNHMIGWFLFTRFYRNSPDIIFDGLYDPIYEKNKFLPYSRRLCLDNNINAKYLNMNVKDNFSSLLMLFFTDYETNKTNCKCVQETLQPVIIKINDS